MSLANSKLKSFSFNLIQGIWVKEDLVMPLGVEPKVVVEVEEANSNRIKEDLAEATKVGDKTILNVMSLARRATL